MGAHQTLLKLGENGLTMQSVANAKDELPSACYAGISKQDSSHFERHKFILMSDPIYLCGPGKAWAAQNKHTLATQVIQRSLKFPSCATLERIARCLSAGAGPANHLQAMRVA